MLKKMYSTEDVHMSKCRSYIVSYGKCCHEDRKGAHPEDLSLHTTQGL